MSEHHYVLREATAHERSERDRTTFQAWGKGLSLEQYLERQQVLRAHPFAKQAMRTWLLERDDMVLASCETYRMKSFLAENSLSGVSECLASVYVEKGFRGKGYAAEMLVQILLLGRREEIQASILFSEVGERLYGQFGYQPMKGSLWMFQPELKEKLPSPQVEWVSPKDLHEIVGKSGVVSPGEFSLSAQREQFDYHLHKARFYGQALKRKPIERIGAARDGAWILWAHDFVASQLLVLWMEAPNQDEARQLIAASLDEIEKQDLDRVVVWPNSTTNELLSFGRRAPFQDIPMVLPISPDLRARDWASVGAVHRF